MKFYTFDYQSKEYTGSINIEDPVREYDSRIPGNAVTKEPPAIEDGQKIKWDGRNWSIIDIPTEIVPESELEQLTREEQINLVIRPTRDQKLRELQDRVDRYHNQIAGGIPSTENEETIMRIYLVMQQLRDFPAVCIDPFNPVWPGL